MWLYLLAAMLLACGSDEMAADDDVADADGGELGQESDAAALPRPADAASVADAGSLEDAGLVAADGSVTDGSAQDSAVEPIVDAAVTPPCTPLYFRDADGDGFGDPAQGSCAAQTGYVTDSSDCYDANPIAYPGQTGAFVEHRGDGSFDFDCSGAVELQVTRFATCPELDDSCPPPNHQRPTETCDYDAMANAAAPLREGWSLYQTNTCLEEPCPEPTWSTIPKCGETGRWGIGIVWSPGYSCVDPGPRSLRVQTCH
jgi:hypothetical protein